MRERSVAAHRRLNGSRHPSRAVRLYGAGTSIRLKKPNGPNQWSEPSNPRFHFAHSQF